MRSRINRPIISWYVSDAFCPFGLAVFFFSFATLCFINLFSEEEIGQARERKELNFSAASAFPNILAPRC